MKPEVRHPSRVRVTSESVICVFCSDLDSLASSIGFAWLLSHKPTADTKTIALITTPREDFVLRAENLYALQLVGIKDDFQELLCPEDLPNPNL